MKKFTFMCLASLATVAAYASPLSPMSEKKPVPQGDEISVNGQRKKTAQVPHALSSNVRRNQAPVVEAPDGATYSCRMNSQEEFDTFINADANGDGTKWTFYTNNFGIGYAAIGYSATLDMNDWLISPEFALEAGKKYVISIDAWASSTSYPEKIALYLGQGTTPEDASITVLEPTLVNNGNPCGFGGEVTVPASGNYRLMVKGCSDRNMSSLCVNNFKVSSPDAVAIPTEVKYTSSVILEQDFSGIGGTEENPVDILDSNFNIIGYDGWRGVGLKGAGGKILVQCNGNPDAQFVPKRATFTQGNRGRVTIEASIAELSETAAMFNNWEYLMFTGMVGSTDCPNGWKWGGNTSDFIMDLPSDLSTVSTTKEVSLIDSGTLLDDNLASWDIVELGEYNVNQLSARIKSGNESNVYIKSYKVEELVPELGNIQSYKFDNYTADGFSASWEPVEGAERYVASLYIGDSSGYSMSLLDKKVVSEPNVSFNTDTSDGRFLYLMVYPANSESRGNDGAIYRVFLVNTPTVGPVDKPVGNKITVPYTCDSFAHELQIFALAGKTNDEAVPDYTIADFDFADYASMGTSGEAYTYILENVPGWIIYPLPVYDDGAFKGNNGQASWHAMDYQTVEGRCAYDFSNIDGNVNIDVTARTAGSCFLTASLVTFDENERYFRPFVSESQLLTSEYQTLHFSLDPQHQENVFVRISIGGDTDNWIKDVRVSCALPANSIFMQPYLTGAIDLRNSSATSGRFELNVPQNVDKVRVAAQAYRGLIDSGGTLYYNALSPFAVTDVQTPSSGISDLPDGNENGTPVYYNLQGLRVNDMPAGVYIKVVDGKSSKVIIK